MDLLILSCVFGGVWLITTLTFVVMYKKKGTNQSNEKEIKQIVENQKEQNLLLNNMLMQAMKNVEVGTQNTVNNLSVLQKQEFESMSKRVDELTVRN